MDSIHNRCCRQCFVLIFGLDWNSSGSEPHLLLFRGKFTSFSFSQGSVDPYWSYIHRICADIPSQVFIFVHSDNPWYAKKAYASTDLLVTNHHRILFDGFVGEPGLADMMCESDGVCIVDFRITEVDVF